jgi:hypothetical protein
MIEKLKDDFYNGKELIICVIAAIGQEKIVAFRESSS